MWEWIAENSAGLNVVISVVTVFVWVGYFQLLFLSFRRQRRTRILINRGAGRGTDARCLISNMGAEPLYVISIIGTLEKGGTSMSAEISDLDSYEVGEVSKSSEATNQGPLESGEFMDIGKFSALMARCARALGESEENVSERFDGLKLTVIAAYGADDLSVGATRRFVLETRDGWTKLDPERISTRQLRARRERRELEKLLYDYR
ncbi:hypothetical protein [Roseovarius sp. D0-M9]|uniref:hypothetical protein n=1 Tax=Roseovarius sp. D0-M9 TaxID=3127117 RepID=UPI003010057F